MSTIERSPVFAAAFLTGPGGVKSAGGATFPGGRTVILTDFWAVFPEVSTAVTMIVVTPIGSVSGTFVVSLTLEIRSVAEMADR